MLKIPTYKDRLLIIDFEATCDENNKMRREEMEIIEFASVLVTKQDYKIMKEFSKFVKPTKHPILTDYCTKLTSITQQDVNSAKPFKDVLTEFNNKMNPVDTVFVSWGDYDRKQLLQDCEFHKVPYPFSDTHINIKKLVVKHLGIKKQLGIERMLQHLNMEFKGTPHRGIDDVKNIIRILKRIN